MSTISAPKLNKSITTVLSLLVFCAVGSIGMKGIARAAESRFDPNHPTSPALHRAEVAFNCGLPAVGVATTGLFEFIPIVPAIFVDGLDKGLKAEEKGGWERWAGGFVSFLADLGIAAGDFFEDGKMDSEAFQHSERAFIAASKTAERDITSSTSRCAHSREDLAKSTQHESKSLPTEPHQTNESTPDSEASSSADVAN